MSMKSTNKIIVIWITIVVALFLSLFRMPIYIESFLPNYLAIVLLYWAIVAPERVSVFTGWISGIILDFLLGSTLGVHAIIYSFMVWVLISQFESIKYYSLFQKTIVVGTINFVGCFLLFWLEHVFGALTVDYDLLWSSISTFFVWPLFYVVMNLFCGNPEEENKNNYA